MGITKGVRDWQASHLLPLIYLASPSHCVSYDTTLDAPNTASNSDKVRVPSLECLIVQPEEQGTI
jgi:hypothetical protein